MQLTKIEAGHYTTTNGDTLAKSTNGKWFYIAAHGESTLAIYATRAVALAALTASKEAAAVAEQRIEEQVAGSLADDKAGTAKREITFVENTAGDYTATAEGYAFAVRREVNGKWHAVCRDGTGTHIEYGRTRQQAASSMVSHLKRQSRTEPQVAATRARRQREDGFNGWLTTFITEKGIDPQQGMTVAGPSGPNYMPVRAVLDAMRGAPAHEQQSIKAMLVRIDFANGSVLDYLRHLAQAIAI